MITVATQIALTRSALECVKKRSRRRIELEARLRGLMVQQLQSESHPMAELRQRTPRQLNPGYLKWLRRQSCACGCSQPAPCDAAHIRSASLKYGKEHTGLNQKPDDRWCLPLRHAHHMRQHAMGDELGFWAAHGIRDVFRLAKLFNARYLHETGRDATEHVARSPARASKRGSRPKATKPRPRPKASPRATAAKPTAKRKIANRTQWAKGRKMQSRGFK